jgi:hypothetical protein
LDNRPRLSYSGVQQSRSHPVCCPLYLTRDRYGHHQGERAVSFSFQFPDVCSRCASRPPTQGWEVRTTQTQSYVIASRHTTYRIKVPVCDTCMAELKEARKRGWLAGIAAAVITLGVMAVLIVAGSGDRAWLVCPVVIAPIVGWIVGLVVQQRTADHSFVSIQIEHDLPWLTFKHPQYNSDFVAMNRPGAAQGRKE